MSRKIACSAELSTKDFLTSELGFISVVANENNCVAASYLHYSHPFRSALSLSSTVFRVYDH